MRLIAKRPCSFGGRQFFIGDEIPAELVADAEQQEKYGVISVVKSDKVVSAELEETELGAYEGTITVSIIGDSDGENEQVTAVQATPEDIQQIFAIMQMNAENGAKAVAEVQSENVLILLHAVDSRKTIKDATKKQADNLFSTQGNNNES